jgi:hypothetical protein
MSGLEAGANVVVGSVVAFATQLVVFPAVGLQATLAQTLTLSGVFTGVSFLRSYLLRRVFEAIGGIAASRERAR